jgi:hypothetical protein
MSDPIRAALEKAAEAVRVSFIEEGSCYGGDACHALPCKCASDAATKAIAAFLRALPDLSVCPRLTCNYNGSGDSSATLADAVLAAAKEEPSSDT